MASLFSFDFPFCLVVFDPSWNISVKLRQMFGDGD